MALSVDFSMITTEILLLIMVLKRLLTRIFKKSEPQDTPATATSPTPEILPPSDRLTPQTAISQSPVTEATLPLNITLRLNVVLSPTGNGWLPHVSLQQGQAFATLGTISEGPTAEGPAPLPNPPVEFKIHATAVQHAKTPNPSSSSLQGLGLLQFRTTSPQSTQLTYRPIMVFSSTRMLTVEILDEQVPNRAATTRPASQRVEVQSFTTPVTPARHSLPRSVTTMPGLARTPRTIESKDIETPAQNSGARSLVQIAEPSVNPPVGVPSMVPTILDESSPQKVNLDLQPQLYEFPRLESHSDEPPLPVPRMDDEPPRCPSGPANGGLHPGYPTREDPQDLRYPPGLGLGSPFKVQQQISKGDLDNGPPPRPQRGETLSFIANMSPTFEPAPFYLQHNGPLRPDAARTDDIDMDSGPVIVQKISSSGNMAYSIRAGGHNYVATAQVGSGGYGYVWYAIKDNKEEVAIKVVDKAGLLARCVYCPDGRLTSRQLLDGSGLAARTIRSEYEAFVRITEEQSPFLAPLLHAFEDKDNFYFVMVRLPDQHNFSDLH